MAFLTVGYATGPFEFYKKKYGSKVLHVGTIAEDLSSALAKQHAIVHAAETAGWGARFSWLRL